MIGIERKFLLNKLKDVIYSIFVFEGDEIVSKGTGVCIHKDGFILSALHVVTSFFPFNHEDLLADDIKIIAISGSGREIELEKEPFNYIQPIKNDFFENSTYIDLVVLKPKLKAFFNSISYSRSKVELGEDVILGGYPEDSGAPFQFTNRLRDNHKQEQKNNLWKFERSLMFKRGMVGYTCPFKINNIEGDLFYIDTELHSGGSGGAVVNYKGELIGIITMRAIINVNVEIIDKDKRFISKTEIPSGIGMAISPRTLLDYISSKL